MVVAGKRLGTLALSGLALSGLALGSAAAAPAQTSRPADLLPPVVSPAPTATPTPAPVLSPIDALVAPQPTGPQPAPLPVMAWSLADAQALLAFLDNGAEAEGLTPADYQADELRTAIAAGPGAALDQAVRDIDGEMAAHGT